MDPEDRLMKMREVEKTVGFSKVHIYHMIGEGRFPRQLRLGPNKVAWLQSEVLAWIGEKAAQRDSAPSGACVDEDTKSGRLKNS